MHVVMAINVIEGQACFLECPELRSNFLSKLSSCAGEKKEADARPEEIR
jgi:hypothetical protein